MTSAVRVEVPLVRNIETLLLMSTTVTCTLALLLLWV